MRSARLDRQTGFTLVEMLVAISILGVMSVVAYRVFDTVLVTRAHVMDQYARWRDVARAITWMERDFEAVQARPVRDASDRIAAPLVGAEVFSAGDAPAVTLTRGGVLDASDFASPPLRVAYRLRDGSLERLTWPGLDQAVQSVPSVSVVLRGVARLGMRYRDASGIWRANWPPAIDRQDPRGSASSHVVREGALDVTLPTAVDMTIQLAGGDQIRRLIVMRSAARS